MASKLKQWVRQDAKPAPVKDKKTTSKEVKS